MDSKRFYAMIMVIFVVVPGLMAACDEKTEDILGTVERKCIFGTFIGQRISQNGYESQRFLGIPYAKAPVGDLRFKPPQDPDRNSEEPR
jgi:hypothetical protein